MKAVEMGSWKKSVRAISTFFSVITLFAMASPAAQAEVVVTEEWAARYNGPAHGSDIARAITTDDAGNVYVTGYSAGSGTGNDYATVAYDPSGNRLWTARYDGPAHSSDNAYAIAVDNAGNVYVTGESWGGRGVNYDYATVAYDSLGNQLWAARYDGPLNSSDMAYAIAVDDAGKVYVTGYSMDSRYRYDYATVAYDSSGNELWVARYDGPAHDSDLVRAIAVDNAGNVYVTGVSWGGIGALFDYATVAYDSSGNELWVARYDGPAHSYDIVSAIAVDNAGNVYVTGWSYGSGTFSDYVTIAYNSSGNQLWLARYNGRGNSSDGAYAIAIDQAGNVYVTGWSWGDSGTSYDYATVAYDPSGNQLWLARYDAPAHSDDVARAIATDDAGNVYVTGQSYGSGTSTDYATVAYDSSGNRLWAARYDGPVYYSDDTALAIATGNDGDVYVTGYIRDGAHGYDYATIKYSWEGRDIPPTADAGPDQTVECASSGGTQVILDGSGSTGPDGDALTYAWTWDGGSAEGANPTVTLPYGTTTVTLTVSDGEFEDSDDVNIAIEDTTPPSTSAILEGEPGQNGWFVSNVDVELAAVDSCTGVKEIRYAVSGAETVVGGDTADFTLTEDGEYAVTYRARDNAGNEASASMTLNIDQTAPVADISLNPGILWPPNHKMVDVAVSGGASDAESGVAAVEFTVEDDYGTAEPEVSGFNTTIPLEAWREGGDHDGRRYTITAVITDSAGNKTTVTTEAVVPHDMRSNKQD